jgi:hypothetical protein
VRHLVCGGRMWGRVPNDVLENEREWWQNKAKRESDLLRRYLSSLHGKSPIDLMIEGGALGADRIAQLWARRNKIPGRTYFADWNTHGKSAGFIRNKQMLTEGKPDLVVAAPGGNGTANMCRLAEEDGVEVRYIVE